MKQFGCCNLVEDRENKTVYVSNTPDFEVEKVWLGYLYNPLGYSILEDKDEFYYKKQVTEWKKDGIFRAKLRNISKSLDKLDTKFLELRIEMAKTELYYLYPTELNTIDNTCDELKLMK